MATRKNKRPPKDRDDFRRILFEKASAPRGFATVYHYYRDIDSRTDPGPLAQLLGMDDGFLSDREANVLSVLEGRDGAKPDRHYREFKWKVIAFLSVQDIFDAPLLAGSDLRSLFRQWYFYYESKYILIETILCGLNGFVGAHGSLLRLFLEFNLLQNYFSRNINSQASYELLERYCERGTSPNWNTVMKGSMPEDAFTKPIKRRILMHLQGLSEHSSHPYPPGFTLTKTGSGLPEPTLERMFLYYFLALILDVVLWLYFVNFPMLFHGVNVESKFGFNPPLGLFVDEHTSQIIRKSLGKGEYQIFYDYSVQQSKVTDLLAWYNQRETLTADRILRTWDVKKDGKIDDIAKGHAIWVAKMRLLKEAMALGPGKDEEEIPEGPEEEFFDRLSSYEWWKMVYKRVS
jgi:hypothetical protein